MILSVYDKHYLQQRRDEIDITEYYDIYWALRSLGVDRESTIVELGAGEGLLLRFLMRKGYRLLRGYDISYQDEMVRKRDLTREPPDPPFDVCISQHFLEHIPQDKALDLLAYCIEEGWASINIIPGHFSTDPTHIINHYEYEDAINLAKKVCRKAGSPCYFRVEPDTMSYISPIGRDWILVISRRRVETLKPKLFHYLLSLKKVAMRVLMRW